MQLIFWLWNVYWIGALLIFFPLLFLQCLYYKVDNFWKKGESFSFSKCRKMLVADFFVAVVFWPRFVVFAFLCLLTLFCIIFEMIKEDRRCNVW